MSSFVLRADNDGEGGILALMSLVAADRIASAGRVPFVVLLGVTGAALLYGDGVITPAISVLSAMEGLKLVAPAFEDFIVPVTLAILIGLFAIQSRGTSSIGRLFGPVMVIWFVVIGLLGFVNIWAAPAILRAIDPLEAARFVVANPVIAFAVMGSVFLALTGAEALYADMGHVGATAIRRAWFGLVLPALLLNYFGQGALVLADPKAIDSPFYKLAPSWALIPMVMLAALATIIASQALISGVFSLTRQAMQLGLCPRMRIVPTSSDEAGQIDVPTANWLLMAGTLLVVVLFKTSSNLAGAYGIAVSGTMLITTILLYRVAITRWQLAARCRRFHVVVFGVIDSIFLASNSLKIVDGGWFPLVVGGVILMLMLCWRQGTLAVRHRLQDTSMPLADFVANIDRMVVARAPGTGVWLTKVAQGVSPMLLHHVHHNSVMHQHRRSDDLCRRPAAARPARSALRDGAARPRLLPHPGRRRIHAEAEHSVVARALPIAGFRRRSRSRALLHRPRSGGPARGEFGDGSGSVRDLRVPEPHCEPRPRFLQILPPTAGVRGGFRVEI